MVIGKTKKILIGLFKSLYFQMSYLCQLIIHVKISFQKKLNLQQILESQIINFKPFFDGPVKKMLLVRSFLPQPLGTTIDKGFNSFGKLSW